MNIIKNKQGTSGKSKTSNRNTLMPATKAEKTYAHVLAFQCLIQSLSATGWLTILH